MKLKDLFEDKALPFEIKELELPDFNDQTSSKKIGTFDGYTIWGNRFNDLLDAYGIVDDDMKPMAVLYIHTTESLYDSKKCQQIEKIWVDKNHRGKALAISLLAFVIRKTQTKLISNKIITDDGEQLYRKIISRQTFDVEIFNSKTKQTSNIIPDDLFSYPNRYRIILEKEDLASQDFELFEGRLSHYRFFRDDTDCEWN